MKTSVASSLLALLLFASSNAEPFPQIDTTNNSTPVEGAEAVIDAIDRWAFSTIQVNSFVDMFAENATEAVEDKNILSAQGFARTEAAQFAVVKGMAGLSFDAQEAINQIGYVLPKIVAALDRITSEDEEMAKADIALINTGRCCQQLPAMETLFREAVKAAKLDLGDGVTTVVTVPVSCEAVAAQCQDTTGEPTATQQTAQTQPTDM
jgi:hypothetical protein